jgi:hypothetical protein
MARGGRTAQQQRFARAAKVCTRVLGRGASRTKRNACMKRELTGGGFRGYGPHGDSDWTGDDDLGYGSPMGRRHRGGKRRRSYRGRHGGTVLYR